MDTRIIPADEAGIAKAVETLKSGGLVGLPTETVFGLAADASNESAVGATFAAKGRPKFDPLIVHISADQRSLEDLEEQEIVSLEGVSQRLREKIQIVLMDLWPGPMTVLLPKGIAISDLITAGSREVALRCPSHVTFQSVLKKLRRPITAPSANRFGHVSPTSAAHVYEDLAGKIPLVLDAERTKIGIESTIFRPCEDGFQVLRQGGVSADALSPFFGNLLPNQPKVANVVEAPGTLSKHYSPDKPTFLWPEQVAEINAESVAVILPADDTNIKSLVSLRFPKTKFFELSKSGDELEAASSLYDVLRTCERDKSTDAIAIVLPKDKTGLWPAITDRLRRAASN